MTLPGVGVATAQAIVAAIGDISRFETADKLAAYFGLVPSVHQSTDHAYHERITKQGNSNVRWLLVEVAHHAGRHPGPLGHQFTRLARKKGVPVARVAIARKLAILAWHLLTKNEPYRYALPASTEHKLAELRRSQGIRHRLGPEKGQPQLPKKSYQRVRVQRGLDEVLTTESLPLSATGKLVHGLQRVSSAIGVTSRVHLQLSFNPHRVESNSGNPRLVATVLEPWHHQLGSPPSK